ncbi:MAG: D-arabino 3-hexulose 6-phosphate aldehyde lyase [Thermoprotei archaeon]|nr:MAG: D-arabino 3-hexulose 6-phosphate aldehyde lyase [Thermoprotei archaeon]
MVLLQVALDLLDLERAIFIGRLCSEVGFDIVEAGTPLIKRFGVEVLRVLRERVKPRLLLADMKTVDAADVEVGLVREFGGDITTVLAVASPETIELAIRVGREVGVEVMVDLMNVHDVLGYVGDLIRRDVLPDYVCYHVGVDVQRRRGVTVADLLREVKELRRILPSTTKVAVAGGIKPGDIPSLLNVDVDVIIVGGAITRAENPREVAEKIVKLVRG